MTVSLKTLADAIRVIENATFNEVTAKADRLAAEQPHLFGSFLVQQRFGVPMEDMDKLLRCNLVCYEALTSGGVKWPVIPGELIETELQRFCLTLKDSQTPDGKWNGAVQDHYLKIHREVNLLAYVTDQCSSFFSIADGPEYEKYVVMAAYNFVNCFTAVKPLKKTKRGT